MKFTKMHGTGNDFVLVDGRAEKQDWNTLAVAMCDRHFGIGGDGILVVRDSMSAEYQMRMFNPDGSESEMCGNGIRCFTKYLFDNGLASKGASQARIETLAGIRQVTYIKGTGGIDRVRVGMGKPILRPQEVPVAARGEGPLLDYPVTVDGRTVAVTCVSMGNPHAVAFVDKPVKDWPLERVGPLMEHHSFFPRRVNFEIANVKDRAHVDARVWERGAGLTLACGTGACAVAVAARLHGLVEDNVDVTLPGGTLHMEWDGRGEVWLEGPAETVFEGVWARAT